MTSVPATSSPVAALSQGSDTKSTASGSGDRQAFDQVLSRRIEQHEPSQPMPQKQTADPAGDAVSEETVNPQSQQPQGVDAISPWLQMLAQAVPTKAEAETVAQSELPNESGNTPQADSSGLILLTAGVAVPMPSVPVSNPVDKLAVKVSAEDGLTGSQRVDLPFAASVSTPTGKDLPQELATVAEVSDFSKEFIGKLNAAEDVSTLQPAQAPSVAFAGKTENAGQINVARHAVAEPVGDNRWGDAVAQRVSLMLGRQEQQLEMQLNPPHLGPMEVRLTMGGEQASVVFASQSAAVREALTAATPRLTALLADQGIQLVNVQVASDSLNQQAQEQARQQAAFGGQGGVRQQTSGQFELESVGERRVLTGVNIPAARSGVSLYV